MTNFYNRGLYSEPFFRKINNLVFEEDYMFDTICDDYVAFFKHYKSQIEQIELPKNTDRYLFICNSILELVLLDKSKKCLYFQPLIFKPDIALECGLIPFVTRYIKFNSNSLYNSRNQSYINVLILSSRSNESNDIDDLSPRLDAYQALTDNSIDCESLLFREEEHFQSIVGKSLTEKVKFATFI